MPIPFALYPLLLICCAYHYLCIYPHSHMAESSKTQENLWSHIHQKIYGYLLELGLDAMAFKQKVLEENNIFEPLQAWEKIPTLPHTPVLRLTSIEVGVVEGTPLLSSNLRGAHKEDVEPALPLQNSRWQSFKSMVCHYLNHLGFHVEDFNARALNPSAEIFTWLISLDTEHHLGELTSLDKLICEYLSFLKFDPTEFKEKIRNSPRFEQADYWEKTYSSFLEQPMQPISAPLPYPSQSLSSKADLKTILRKNTKIRRQWDHFHIMVHGYLNLFGFHGDDFKGRTLDPQNAKRGFEKLDSFLNMFKPSLWQVPDSSQELKNVQMTSLEFVEENLRVQIPVIPGLGSQLAALVFGLSFIHFV